MLIVYNTGRGVFVNAHNSITHEDFANGDFYNFGWGRRLKPCEVRLQPNAAELQGFANGHSDAPGYGFDSEWQADLRARGLATGLPMQPGADEPSIKQSPIADIPMRRPSPRPNWSL